MAEKIGIWTGIKVLHPFMEVRTWYDGMYGVRAAPLRVGHVKLEGRTYGDHRLHSPEWARVAERFAHPWWEFIGNDEAFDTANYAAHRAFMNAVSEQYPGDSYNTSTMNGVIYHVDKVGAFRLHKIWVETFFKKGGKAVEQISLRRPKETNDIWEYLKPLHTPRR